MRLAELRSALSPCVNRALEIPVSRALTCDSEEQGEMNSLIQALSGWVRRVMILKQSAIGGFTECKAPERTVQRSKRTDANVAATSGDPYWLYVHIKHTKSCTQAEIKFIKGEVFNFCTTSSTMTVFGQVSPNTSPTCLWLDKTLCPTSNSCHWLLCWIAQTNIKSATEPKCYTLFAKIIHLHLLRNACSSRDICECELWSVPISFKGQFLESTQNRMKQL